MSLEKQLAVGAIVSPTVSTPSRGFLQSTGLLHDFIFHSLLPETATAEDGVDDDDDGADGDDKSSDDKNSPFLKVVLVK